MWKSFFAPLFLTAYIVLLDFGCHGSWQRSENNDIGKYTLLSTEGLVALVNQASEEYETGLQWLVNNMAKPACMKCKPGAFKAPIRIT